MTTPSKRSTMSAQSGDTLPRSSTPGRSWRNDILFTAVVLVVATVVLSWCATQTADVLDQDYKNVVSTITLGVAGLLLAGWYWSRSSLPRLAKWLVPLVGLVILVACIRFEDFTADMRFQLAWRFMPRPDQRLPQAETEVAMEATRGNVGRDHDYPRFLGADGRATVENVALATDWKNNPPRLLWRQPIGAGWSAFSIVGDYAITQEQRGADELVVCYERKTGRIVWSHQDKTRFQEVLGGIGPRATPTVDDDRVYTQGATGLLNCLQLTSGRPIWTRDILTDNSATQIQWGRSGSPLIVDDKVVVSAGGPNGRSLVAYNKWTGQPTWSAGNDQSSYASPVLATLAGRRQVVTVNEDHVRGHDVEDGRPLWSFPWPGDSSADANTSQPVPLGDDRIFVSKGYLQGCALFEIRTSNHDNFTAHLLWRSHKSLKTKMTNVVVYQDHLYGLSGGILECVQIEGLKRKWKRGRYGHGQLLLVGGLLLITSEQGELVLVRATPQRHEELAKFQALEGKTWNNPALAGPYLLVRNHLEAACYQLPVLAKKSAAKKTTNKDHGAGTESKGPNPWK